MSVESYHTHAANMDRAGFKFLPSQRGEIEFVVVVPLAKFAGVNVSVTALHVHPINSFIGINW